ncbi:hypothetical protein [Streptomyces sp. bgisy091]|uniref:hypothetical protein n=1 Tax=Streptomyces sp. bgisy091 TaxID=3413778 RepID=UPI003D74CA49
MDVRLHPQDRDLTGPEWAEVAHRLARAAGIEIPGKEHGCRWVAVQAQPRRLDLIANLIHLDGAWHAPPTDSLRRLSDQARRIEQDLNLIPVRTGRSTIPAVPTASAQLARFLTQLAEEQAGPLATVRGLIEHTAHRLESQPGPAGAEAPHGLELIARRLHAIQQDLDATAERLIRYRRAFPACPALRPPVTVREPSLPPDRPIPEHPAVSPLRRTPRPHRLGGGCADRADRPATASSPPCRKY